MGCFILEDPSSRFSILFQVIDVVAHGDIPKSMTLMLGGGFGEQCPLLGCFMMLIIFFTTSMGGMWRGSTLLNHLQA